MRAARLGVLALGVVAGLFVATEYTAWLFAWPSAFGAGLRLGADAVLYPPWEYLRWRGAFGTQHAASWSGGASLALLVVASFAGAAALLPSASSPSSDRKRGWGDLQEAKRAGLLSDGGCVLGEFQGRILTTLDLRPTLVTGGTRSGKGRGHVMPTLLSWMASVLAHDPKGELWRATSGWRSSFSHALYFNPRDPASARINFLAEIRPGPQEVAEVQRLVAILSDPGGTRDDEAIWDKAASEILEAVILHVLYTAPDEDKTLVTVTRLLADLDATAEVMLRTQHRQSAQGAPETHPFIDRAVRGYGAMHDRFRTSVQGTARSYLKWLAGEDVERALSASDILMSDLMCAEAPVSLYIQVSPADQKALKPLVRLLFYAASQALTAQEDAAANGRPKRHKLLMLMDEFPLLGRLEFFEKSLRLMSGYGLKAMFAAQSLNDIAETYGVYNTILDNCFVYTAFSALDPVTQEKVSKLTGTVEETRETLSAPAGLGSGRRSVTRSPSDRPLLEPGEVRALDDDDQLMFVAGRKPLRVRKVRYDQREPFRTRANVPAARQDVSVDAPPRRPHPWAGRRALGVVKARQLDLFPEQKTMIAAKDAKAVQEAWREEQAATDAVFEDMRNRD